MAPKFYRPYNTIYTFAKTKGFHPLILWRFDHSRALPSTGPLNTPDRPSSRASRRFTVACYLRLRLLRQVPDAPLRCAGWKEVAYGTMLRQWEEEQARASCRAEKHVEN